MAELPGLVGWFWEITYDLLILWSAFLLLLALFAPGRKRLFLYQVLAVAMALGFAVLGSVIGGTDAWTSLKGLIDSSSPPIYLATRIAFATAVVVMASPHLARPWRLIGRWLIGIGAVSGIALGAVLPIGVAAGFLIGFASAALVHLLVGSPGAASRSVRCRTPSGNSAWKRPSSTSRNSSRKGWSSPSRPRPTAGPCS